MKTAISLPDPLYLAAEKVATRLGIPRSQLFARALEEFIYNHKEERITEELNKIYSNNITSEISDIGLESLRRLTKNDAW
jgi:metal-responsive CopG/Arc/MetJ family transcriptional regulator